MAKSLRKIWEVWIRVAGTLAILEVISLGAELLLGSARYQYALPLNPGEFLYHPATGFTYRSPDPHWFPAENPGHDKLIILGGSMAYGFASRGSDETYYAEFHRRVSAAWKGRPLDLGIFAVPGFVSGQESAAYRSWVFGMEQAPKWVISVTGFNDALMYLHGSVPVGSQMFGPAMDEIVNHGHPEPRQWSRRALNFVRRLHSYALLRSLLGRAFPALSGPIPLDTGWINPLFVERTQPGSELIERAARNFLDNELGTALLARERGSRYFVVLQPAFLWGGEILSTLPREYPYSGVFRGGGLTQSVWQRREIFTRFYDRVAAGLEEMQRRRLLTFLDYRALMKGESGAFVDVGHLAFRGNQVLGQRLAADFLGQGG